ncbi:hypothetical protein HG530_013765 [Fusarium avenaceum]|nr:hypothetical protein HG530_013765 [Fusarium avenaceum]
MAKAEDGSKQPSSYIHAQLTKKTHANINFALCLALPPSGFRDAPRLLVGPALGHLNGFGPATEPLGGFLLGNLRLEDGAALRVHVLELVEALPDSNGEPGCDCCA